MDTLHTEADLQRVIRRPPELYINQEGDLYRLWPQHYRVDGAPLVTTMRRGVKADMLLYVHNREVVEIHAWFWIVQMTDDVVRLQAWDCRNGFRHFLQPYPRCLYDAIIKLHHLKQAYYDD